MNFRKRAMVHRAICRVAREQGRGFWDIKNQIARTVYLGTHSPNPEVCRAWREIPFSGERLMPEEAVIYWAERRGQ